MNIAMKSLVEKMEEKKKQSKTAERTFCEHIRELYFRQGIEKKFSNTCWCRFV